MLGRPERGGKRRTSSPDPAVVRGSGGNRFLYALPFHHTARARRRGASFPPPTLPARSPRNAPMTSGTARDPLIRDAIAMHAFAGFSSSGNLYADIIMHPDIHLALCIDLAGRCHVIAFLDALQSSDSDYVMANPYQRNQLISALVLLFLHKFETLHVGLNYFSLKFLVV